MALKTTNKNRVKTQNEKDIFNFNTSVIGGILLLVVVLILL